MKTIKEQMSDERINSHKQILAMSNSIVFGVLGLSALMVGLFDEGEILWMKIALIIIGIIPMAISPVMYKKIINSKNDGGLLWLILTIEMLIQKNIINKLTMIYNLGFGIVKIGLGIYTGSFFFAVSALCSFGFGLAKREYLMGTAKSGGDAAIEYKYFVRIAWLIMLCGTSYGLYMARMFWQPGSTNYGTSIGIAIACMSFVEMFFAIKNLTRGKGILTSAIRYLGLAASVQAIAFTQVALTAVSAADSSFGNALMGVVCGGICDLIGLFMLWKYTRYRKAVRNAATQI